MHIRKAALAGYVLLPNQTAEMAEDARSQSSVAIATFQDTDDAAIDTEALFCSKLNNVLRESRVEFSGHIDLVTLHSSALPFTGIEASRQEDDGPRVDACVLQLLRLASEIDAGLVEKYCVLSLVKIPKVVDCLPWLEMGVPDILPVGILDANACVLNLVIVAVFTGIRVDVVQTEIANGRLLPGGMILGGGHGPGVVRPGNGLRAISMVQVKVDDGSVGEAMVEDAMHDANMDIIDPAEARWEIGRAVMSRRPNGNKGTARPSREDGIHALAYSAQGALNGIQRLATKVQVALVKLLRCGMLRASGHGRPLQLLSSASQDSLGRLAHGLELLHPFRPVHVGDGRGQQRQPPVRLVDAKGDAGQHVDIALWQNGQRTVAVTLTKTHISRGHAQDAGLDSLGALHNGTQGTLGGARAREAVAVDGIVENDDRLGIERGHGAVMGLELVLEVAARHGAGRHGRTPFRLGGSSKRRPQAR